MLTVLRRRKENVTFLSTASEEQEISTAEGMNTEIQANAFGPGKSLKRNYRKCLHIQNMLTGTMMNKTNRN